MVLIKLQLTQQKQTHNNKAQDAARLSRLEQQLFYKWVALFLNP